MDLNIFFCVFSVQIYSYLFFNVTAVSSDVLLDLGPERLAGLDYQVPLQQVKLLHGRLRD